jgi:hypothetical protein
MKNNVVREYLIGGSTVRQMWIGYRPHGDGKGEEEAIAIQTERGPGAHGSVLSPKAMVSFRPHKFTYSVIDGVARIEKMEQEPPGWFDRLCQDLGCEWFVPMARRMAEGEHVALEEIQASYLAHNGKPMPCGTWGVIFE